MTEGNKINSTFNSIENNIDLLLIILSNEKKDIPCDNLLQMEDDTIRKGCRETIKDMEKGKSQDMRKGNRA